MDEHTGMSSEKCKSKEAESSQSNTMQQGSIKGAPATALEDMGSPQENRIAPVCACTFGNSKLATLSQAFLIFILISTLA